MMIIDLWKDEEYKFKGFSIVCLFFLFLIFIQYYSGNAISCSKFSGGCNVFDRDHYRFISTIYAQIFAIFSYWIVWAIIEIYVYMSFSDVREKDRETTNKIKNDNASEAGSDAQKDARPF